MTCNADDPDLESDEYYTCTEDAGHLGDHITTDGEGGKVLARWHNGSMRRITDDDAMTRLMTAWAEHEDDGNGWNGADAVDFIADLLVLTGRIDTSGTRLDSDGEPISTD